MTIEFHLVRNQGVPSVEIETNYVFTNDSTDDQILSKQNQQYGC